jgi:hypothetical protein
MRQKPQCDGSDKFSRNKENISTSNLAKIGNRQNHNHYHNNSLDEYYNGGSEEAYEVVSNQHVRLKDKINHFSTYDVAQNFSSESVSKYSLIIIYRGHTTIGTIVLNISGANKVSHLGHL